MRIIIQKNKEHRFLMILLVLFVIYSTDSLLVSISTIKPIEYGSYAILGVLATIFFFKMMMDSSKISGILLLFIICIAFSSLFNFDTSFIGIIKIFSIIIGFYIANKLNNKCFINVFIYVMAFIAVFSLIVYFFREVVASSPFPVITGYLGQQFKILFFSNIRLGMGSYRNWGPFWEPGAYQIYLVVALFFLMFEDSKIKYRKALIVVFIVTLITTMSTTGLLALPFLLIAYILDTSPNNKNVLIKIVLVITAAVFVFWFTNSIYFERVFLDKIEFGYDIDRVATVRYGLQLFVKKPIFGYSSTYTAEFHRIAGTSFSITNTFIANLVVYGVVVGLLTILLFIKFVFSYKRSIIVTVLMLMALVISFSGEMVLYSPLFSFLLFYRTNDNEYCTEICDSYNVRGM